MPKRTVLLIPPVCGCGAAVAPAPASPAPATGEPTACTFAIPDRSFDDGDFVIEIARSFEGDDEACLILDAEAAWPERQDVLALIGDEKHQEWAGVTDEPLWWFRTFDDVRIPYAITEAALPYYAGVIDAFIAGDFSPAHGIVMKKSTLKYSASVEHHESFTHEGRTFQDVDVVHLSLSWFQYCGGECAMGFHKERIVVFGPDGGVLAVFGDGETPYIVS
ncbi:MAG: hypothetical protein JRG91_04510 [Deltaproteobacteria bacterium]|nr:hypothetical protein [Deltaproteobacteria bacterium]